MKRLIRIGSRTVPLWLLLAAVSIAAVFAASVLFGVVDIGYKITPTSEEAPTMTPSPLSLDLGTIPSGSSDVVEFTNVATLDLPVGYEITFTLDLATTGDFTTFDVHVYLYRPGETVSAYFFFLQNSDYWNDASEVVEAGTYDVHVEITYTADSVTEETTGTVKIEVSFPG